MKLFINNSICKFIGLNSQQFKELAEIMSYRIDPQTVYFSSDARKGKRYLLNKHGEFPTGLLYLAKAWIEKKRLPVEILDDRAPPMPQDGLFTLRLPHTPYPEQIEAAEACSAFKRGIVTAPTGCGKSVIAALIIQSLSVRTLVVTPTVELKKQLICDMSDYFGPDRVGPLKDSPDIAIENVAALNPSVAQAGYDCVIIDEFHHSGAVTYRNLNKKAWNSIYYRFGLTATPFRSQDHERLLLESVLSQVIYRVDYKTAVEKGYIVPMEAYYYQLPKKKVKGYLWPEVYSELVVQNEERNALVTTLLQRLQSQAISTLCLVKEISHGENITKGTDLDFVKGENDDNREKILAFNRREISTLVATSGVLGEGIDTKPAEIIIIAGLGKSKNQFMQQVGRGFRKYPSKESCKIILFFDPSHRFTSSHFKAQVKILKDEYGLKPAKLEIE